MAIETQDEFGNFSHGGNVSSNIKDIGYQQQQDDAFEHDRRECGLDIGGKSHPGHTTDLSAHGLNRCH
jgi:hypothetical protein